VASENQNMEKQQIADKASGKNEFFEVEQDRPLAHWGYHVLAGVICVIFAMWLWILNPVPEIHGDQINIVTMALSNEHPDNFVRDPIFSSKIADTYPLLPRLITDFLIDKFGVIGGHRVAEFPLSIAYLFVMYGILYYLTRSVPGALLVTLSSAIWRWSLGSTYWGLDRLQAVQPRSYVVIFVPVLFILFWKLRNNWKLVIAFFITGLLFNLNPPSSLFFASLAWLSLLCVGPYNRNKFLYLIGAGAAFVTGALPYLYTNLTVRGHSDIELSGQVLREYINSLEYLYNQISPFPIPSRILAQALLFGFSVTLFLAVIGWCMRSKRRNMFDTWLACFFLLAFILPVIAQYAMQQISLNYKISPLFLSCMRANKFAYLVLYIYIAWFLSELFRRFSLRERTILIAVTAVIIAIMPMFGNNSRSLSGQLDYNIAQMDALLGGKKIDFAGWFHYIENVSAWARQKTPKNSLFLFVHRDMSLFRIYALRSIVTSDNSGCMAYYRSPKALMTWTRYQQELEKVIATRDVSRLLKLAGESKADYIITPNGFPEVTGWTLVMRDQYWTVYQKP